MYTVNLIIKLKSIFRNRYLNFLNTKEKKEKTLKNNA